MSIQPATLCRFTAAPHPDVRVGLVEGGSVRDLTAAGVRRLDDLLEHADLAERARTVRQSAAAEWPVDQVRLLTPVESQEIWAAGVTYLRSKQARMEESDFSARAYDHVYEAAAPGDLLQVDAARKSWRPASAVGIRQRRALERARSRSWRWSSTPPARSSASPSATT